MEIYFIGEEGLFEDKEIKYSSFSELDNFLENVDEVSIDIETTRKYNGKYGEGEGLSPYLSNIVMFQIGNKDKQFVIDHRYNKLSQKVLDVLRGNKVLKIGHNLKFEYQHIFHHYGVRLENIYDTQVAEMILSCGLEDVKVGLKDLIERYLNKTVEKTTRLEFLRIHDRPFSFKQIMYGAEDIYLPLLIKEKQLDLIHKQQLQNTLSLEMKFTLVLGDIEYKGMYFDKNAWEKVYEKTLPLFNQSKKVLDKYVEDFYPQSKFITRQLDLFSDPGCNIQWTSAKQVTEFLKWLKACPLIKDKKTKKMKYTAGAKSLASSLNDMNKDKPEHFKKFVKDYITFKEYEQRITTFGLDFFKHINPITKRIHSNYWQIVSTGRMSSKEPNLQNIPSDEEYRRCFNAPDGYKIINADYSGQETVVLANVSKEPNIGKLITEGGCMHCFVTKAIDPTLRNLSDSEIKKHHADKRQIAKAAGFAIQYGGTGYTIAQNLGISQEEGDKVFDAYFKAFPKLKEYFNAVQNKTKKLGYVLIDDITHRKSYYNPPKSNKEVHAVMKKALNFPIQGTSGSMTKLAAIYIRKFIIDNNYQNEVFITNIVHDEVNLEGKEYLAEFVKQNVEKEMLKAAAIWCKDVPMKATAVVTDFWGH